MTNNTCLQERYLEDGKMECVTIKKVGIDSVGDRQFVEDLKKNYPELEDHLNLISIENAENKKDGMETEADSAPTEIVRALPRAHWPSTIPSATCTT